MTATEHDLGQGPNDEGRPCRDLSAPEKPVTLFARVALRLAELARISTGQAADRTFDTILCPVPEGDVSTWQPPVRPGHWAAFSFHGARAFEPLQSLYLARIRGDADALLSIGALPSRRVNTSESARSFLTEIGLSDIRVYAEQLGYHLQSANEWSDILSYSSLDMQAAHLPIELRDRLKAEHLAEVAALTEGGPLWVEVQIIFAMGRRPR